MPGSEADQASPCNADIKNMLSYTDTFPNAEMESTWTFHLIHNYNCITAL